MLSHMNSTDRSVEGLLSSDRKTESHSEPELLFEDIHASCAPLLP
jgi:hypothetical protein